MSAQPEDVLLLTAWEYRLTDDLLAALEGADARGLVPSVAALRARCTQADARRLLEWLVAHRLAHSTGNGRLTRYYAGRG